MSDEIYRQILRVSTGDAEGLKLGLQMMEERGCPVWFAESSKFEEPETPTPDHFWLTFPDDGTESVILEPLSDLDRAILLGWLIQFVRDRAQRKVYWTTTGSSAVAQRAVKGLPLAAYNADRELGGMLAAAVGLLYPPPSNEGSNL